MIPLILICIAIICITAPGAWPFSPSSLALLLTVVALIMICTGWHGALR